MCNNKSEKKEMYTGMYWVIHGNDKGVKDRSVNG